MVGVQYRRDVGGNGKAAVSRDAADTRFDKAILVAAGDIELVLAAAELRCVAARVPDDIGLHGYPFALAAVVALPVERYPVAAGKVPLRFDGEGRGLLVIVLRHVVVLRLGDYREVALGVIENASHARLSAERALGHYPCAAGVVVNISRSDVEVDLLVLGVAAGLEVDGVGGVVARGGDDAVPVHKMDEAQIAAFVGHVNIVAVSLAVFVAVFAVPDERDIRRAVSVPAHRLDREVLGRLGRENVGIAVNIVAAHEHVVAEIHLRAFAVIVHRALVGGVIVQSVAQ